MKVMPLIRGAREMADAHRPRKVPADDEVIECYECQKPIVPSSSSNETILLIQCKQRHALVVHDGCREKLKTRLMKVTETRSNRKHTRNIAKIKNTHLDRSFARLLSFFECPLNDCHSHLEHTEFNFPIDSLREFVSGNRLQCLRRCDVQKQAPFLNHAKATAQAKRRTRDELPWFLESVTKHTSRSKCKCKSDHSVEADDEQAVPMPSGASSVRDAQPLHDTEGSMCDQNVPVEPALPETEMEMTLETETAHDSTCDSGHTRKLADEDDAIEADSLWHELCFACEDEADAPIEKRFTEDNIREMNTDGPVHVEDDGTIDTSDHESSDCCADIPCSGTAHSQILETHIENVEQHVNQEQPAAVTVNQAPSKPVVRRDIMAMGCWKHELVRGGHLSRDAVKTVINQNSERHSAPPGLPAL